MWRINGFDGSFGWLVWGMEKRRETSRKIRMEGKGKVLNEVGQKGEENEDAMGEQYMKMQKRDYSIKGRRGRRWK
jgi:hypothetical protein